jgi:hypothetical protein
LEIQIQNLLDAVVEEKKIRQENENRVIATLEKVTFILFSNIKFIIQLFAAYSGT